MRRGAAALAAVALAGCPAPRASSRPPPIPLAPAEHHEEAALAGVVHVVRHGDTLYRIARAYGIDLADLMETNGISDPRNVPVGTEIFVPGAAHVIEVPPAPSPTVSGAAHVIEVPTVPSPSVSTERHVPSPTADAGGEGTTASAGTATSTVPLTSRATTISAPAPKPTPTSTSTPSPAAPRGRHEPSPPPIAPSEGASGGEGESARLSWPLRGVLYGRYGVRDGRRHDGVDIAAPEGATVTAAAAGTVIYAGEQAGYGGIVILRHEGGLVTLYAHNSRLLVSEGDRVARGEAIARVGQTGRTTGPHLHFEVREGTRPRNPLLFLQ